MLSKELAKLLYLSGRSMCRMTNTVSWDFFQNLCLAIKTMFSIWQVVCVFFAVYKKYTCSFPNERWYKLWLKIEVTCFSNTRFTCKIIFDISTQAKFVSLRRQPGAVLAPVSHRSSRRRRQWKRLLLTEARKGFFVATVVVKGWKITKKDI